MKNNKDTIKNISALAKLELTKKEETKIMNELNDVLEYMHILNSLDTVGVEPLSHLFDTTNVMREDIAEQSFSRDELLKNSPQKTCDMFIVPKAVD